MSILIGAALVTLACGLLGGYGGYLIEQNKLETSVANNHAKIAENQLYLRMSLVLGVIAALTVPAFLQIMALGSGTTTLFKGVLSGEPDKWFVYAGFCLVAGVSGQQFVRKLSSRLLDEAISDSKEALSKIEKAKDEVEEIREDLEVVALSGESKAIDESSLKVLRTVNEHAKSQPSLEDIVEHSGMSEETVSSAIKELEKQYILSGKESDGKLTWRVRSAGRAILKEKSQNQV